MRAVLLALLCLFASAPTARAHGTDIAFAVAGDGGGAVRAAALWGSDPHPVEVPVTALMTADGPSRIGPVPMRPVPGFIGVYESPTALPAGSWTVAVESARPALGSGRVTLEVGVVTGFPPDFPPMPGSGPPWWLLGVVGALVVVAAWAWVRPSRRR